MRKLDRVLAAETASGQIELDGSKTHVRGFIIVTSHLLE
jgi:hypothetical protein